MLSERISIFWLFNRLLLLSLKLSEVLLLIGVVLVLRPSKLFFDLFFFTLYGFFRLFLWHLLMKSI